MRKRTKSIVSEVLALLIIMSTLFVGTIQANAAISYWRVCGDFNGWGASTDVISGSPGEITLNLKDYVGKTIEFKMVAFENGGNTWCATSGQTLTSGTAYKMTWGGSSSNMKYTVTNGDVNFKISVINNANYVTVTEQSPTEPVTDAPTAAPTDAPTTAPTNAPTTAPTDAPTTAPTDAPTTAPTDAPTVAPTDAPTVAPTDAPTTAPTDTPTAAPTDAPTAAPTDAPTAAPTDAPTAAPTDAPTTNDTKELKQKAFTGKTLWVDTAENPSLVNSTLSLVKMYEKSSGSYYLYLPETANVKNLPVYFSGYSSVKIGNQTIKSGDEYSFDADSSYTLYLNGSNAGSLKIYKSTSPAMYLSTKESMPTTTYAKSANGTPLDNKDAFSTSGTLATSEQGKSFQETSLKKIKGRGNSSWQASYECFGKYSYNITLGSKTKIYSTMNSGKKYCLLANNADESYLRNVFTFALADQIGLAYTPTFQYVDLYDNGEYMGSFMVTDKIEVNSQSVDLAYNLDDLNETANKGTDLSKAARSSSTGNVNDTTTANFKKWVDMKDPTTDQNGNTINVSNGDGAYLLEFELQDRFADEISGFISNKGQQVVVKVPELASKAEINYVSSLFNKAENVVYNSTSTLADLEKVIDVDSFLKVFLIQELSENLDSCATSYYIYIDSSIDNRLHAAPVWDYDWSYGQYNQVRQIASSTYKNPVVAEQWYAKIKEIYRANQSLGTTTGIKNFQAAAANNSYAWNQIKVLWNGTDGFYNIAKTIANGNDSIKGSLAYYIKDVEGSAKMNESRWDFIAKNPILLWGSADTGSTYSATTSYLKNWINARLDWMHNGTENTTPLKSEAIIPTNQYIYFNNNSYNWNNIYAYIYNSASDIYETWSGSTMTYDSATGYYKIQVPAGYENAYVIFNNGSGTQVPGQNQSGFKMSGKSILFANGTVTEYELENPTEAPTEAPTAIPTETPTETPTENPTEPNATKTIQVGIAYYLIDSGKLHGDITAHYWNNSLGISGDATLVDSGKSINCSVGSQYWNNQSVKFYLYTVEIPASADGFKLHMGNTWYGNDVTLTNGQGVLMFEYGGGYIYNQQTL
ncbi:MAG TPA: starch-binding protein [Clostridiales bacterium]|nr:starch-binding protein [Clostridiales bacterium]